MFKEFKTGKYSFDGVEKEVVEFNLDYDFSNMNSDFYSEKHSDGYLLDNLSILKFKYSEYYYIPLYTSNILNPFIELPPSSNELDTVIDKFKSAMQGLCGTCFMAGDIIVNKSSSTTSGFNVDTRFAYISEVDEELNKLKILQRGICSGYSSNYVTIRKIGNEWKPIVSPFSTGMVLSNIYFDDFGNSPVQFIDNNGVVSKQLPVAGYTGGQSTGDFISISETSNYINKRDIFTLPLEKQLSEIGDRLNGSIQ